MDNKKLDRWAELLLDTGKSNSLINFKDTKTSTVEVLIPSADTLLEKADGAAAFEVFDPKITEKENDDDDRRTSEQEGKVQIKGDENEEHDKKQAFLHTYSANIERQNQMLLYSSALNPLTAVKNIDKKAREYIEETGVNVAYIAFGFIHWKESDASEHVFRAPVLLVPIVLEQDSAIEPYFIKFAEDDIIVNPTFAYKLEAERGVNLPEYADEGLSAYLEKVGRIVEKLGWTVSAECKIGIFSFLKINMYRDLKDNAESILANRNVRCLLGEPTDTESVDSDSDSALVLDPLIELHSVVDADSSQIDAIEMAKSGKSFVLQGPPGTGKSQTITNIIAECLGDGKKVLFVSEKLAALGVVYEKLRQAGLGEFCLQLHSHKANKKDIIADICHTLRAGKSAVSSKAEAEIAAKKRAMRSLDEYAAELHTVRPIIEKSLYQLYECYAALREAPDVEWDVPRLDSKGEAYLADAMFVLGQFADYIPSVGYDYRKNTWYGYINRDTSHQTKVGVRKALASVADFLRTIMPIQNEVSEIYCVDCRSLESARVWKRFFEFASESALITPELLDKKQFDAVSDALHKMSELDADVLQTRSVIDAGFEKGIYGLDCDGYHARLTGQFEGKLSRLFNSEYKKIISDIRLCKKDRKKPSHAEAVAITERLSFYRQRYAEFSELESDIKGRVGVLYKGIGTDWESLMGELSVLESLHASASFGRLAEHAEFGTERERFAYYAQRLRDAFDTCDEAAIGHLSCCFDSTLLCIELMPSEAVACRLEECLKEIDGLDNWCHFRDLLSKMNDMELVRFVDTAISENIEAEHISAAFKKLFYYQWIDCILSSSPALSRFNRVQQDRTVALFSEKDREQFEINKAKIRAELSAQRPSIDMVASGSELATLLREGEKKRKQKSIRSLLSETGELIQRIKPCFLMSPLSVSTFLSPDSDMFDVVVFDEASQIFPQDAIGAIYRSKQVIVVGDSKQMPPSNFFNASVDVADNDEEIGDVTDFESILDLCSATMKQLRLRWHYRSRYEQLITFSNKNFYDGDLITFPSAKADEVGVGVDYYHVDGVFDRKSHTNRKEAEFVVDLIYKNIEKYPSRSLGVVAFSVAQQDLIDKLLLRRRQSAPEKEFFFKKDVAEPFFIKNLETVQGDERDTIIFSVAYGIDATGRLLHNFGPLNRVGGERRLNVAVTRAKCNVQLVSSMHYADIDLSRTSSEGARLLREYLDLAENGEVALERSVSVGRYDNFDSDFEYEVCEFLRSNGFAVDTQVGCSGFKIDLGLKRPDTSDYVLAIECDGATYHSSKNARDRDRLRQEVLERMGWRFYRVWSTDWFRNKADQQRHLLNAAVEALKTQSEDNDEHRDAEKQESFEEKAPERQFDFPSYIHIELSNLRRGHKDFRETVRDVLKTEAPLSEEWLLKRVVGYFGRQKVTSVVQDEYERLMRGCEQYGIIRRNGFLYLEGSKEIRFRAPGSVGRDIKYIAPEELASGLLEILKQNITADKSGLYRLLASKCGVSRVGNSVEDAMDNALKLLKDSVTVDGDRVSLK